LLVFFATGAVLGMLLVWSQFATWKDAHFSIGWQNATPAAWHSSYLVFIGLFIFVVCVLCVFNVLRYELRLKRGGRK
jgi:ABC-type Fe3+ transport system permease subunit